MEDDDVLAVLRAYPSVYLACHVEHRTRASSPTGLTARDGSLLAHVGDPAGSSPRLSKRRRDKSVSNTDPPRRHRFPGTSQFNG
jgi:hypothetical protein